MPKAYLPPGLPTIAPNDNWYPNTHAITVLPPVVDRKCKSTYIYKQGFYQFGTQCKFTEGHRGKHAGPTGTDIGDVFWDNESEDNTVTW